MNYKVVTMEERPDLFEQEEFLDLEAWPPYMLEDPILDKYWHYLEDTYPQYQFCLIDDKTDQILVIGNCIPLPTELVRTPMPADGIDWMFEQLALTARTHCSDLTLFAIQMIIEPSLLGRGLSRDGIKEMLDIGRKHGCRDAYLPVRPNHKSLYPLMPMATYVNWRRADGLFFDPWMRVHERLGAEVINVCEKSMTIPGSLAQWEGWSELRFPVSGEYVISGGLVPLLIDVENNRGVYVEPNVWMRHRL